MAHSCISFSLSGEQVGQKGGPTVLRRESQLVLDCKSSSSDQFGGAPLLHLQGFQSLL